jgi:hypothetical protein
VVDDRAPGPLPHAALRAEIEAEARRAEAAAGFPADYLGRLRAEAGRFALRNAEPGDLRAAVALLEEQCNVDTLAPLTSRNRGVEGAKLVVRKAVNFALHHLAEQVQALGWATASVGEAAATRIEELEARVRALEARADAGAHVSGAGEPAPGNGGDASGS